MKINTLKQVEAYAGELSTGSIKGAMKAVSAGSKDLWQVPYDSIVVLPGLNPRVMNEAYKEHIENIGKSIFSEGFYQHEPLGGYVDKDNRIILRSGFTRHAGIEVANSLGSKIELVPMAISQTGVSTEDITVAFVKENSGRPLTMYETAIVCKRMVGFGRSPEEIATRLNFSLQYINNLLTLMASPVALREMVASGSIAASLAIDMIEKYGDKALEKIMAALDKAQKKGKTKVTAKDTAGAGFKKALKQNALELYNILKEMEKGKAKVFHLVPDKLYKRIDAVMDEIEEADDRDPTTPKEDEEDGDE